jgi:hypothetical protein
MAGLCLPKSVGGARRPAVGVVEQLQAAEVEGRPARAALGRLHLQQPPVARGQALGIVREEGELDDSAHASILDVSRAQS